jgi:ankyrin repeat protein
MSNRPHGSLAVRNAVDVGDLELVRKYIADGEGLEAVDTWEYKRAALGLAASRGHVEIARFLLEAGANPNGPPESVHGPLSDAVEAGNVEIAQMLIDHGAEVNATDENGWHALLLAASRSDIYPEKEWRPITRLLIAAGSNVNHVDKCGRTALKAAIGDDPGNGSALDVMRILLEAGAEVDARDGDNAWTPLMTAVEEGNIEAVRLLVEAGADVNLMDDEGDTAWNMARRWGYAEIADLLQLAGAVEPADVEAQLHRAILWGKTEAVARLLEQSVDPNTQDRYNRSALLIAIENWGKEEIVRLLLDHGARIAEGKEAVTLLSAAVDSHRPLLDAHTIVRLLIERGADIHASFDDGSTVLLCASERANTETVRLLLDAGAEVNKGDWEGRTPLMLAAHCGNIATVVLLLEHGADVNARTLTVSDSGYYGGATALIHAVKSQHLEIARLLLEHGADVDAADDAGYTSLMWDAGYAFGAEESEGWKSSLALVRLLLEWNADVNRQNIHKNTALDYAISGIWGSTEDEEGELSEIALLLKQAGAVRGEPRPRWCYMAVPCDGEPDLPTE